MKFFKCNKCGNVVALIDEKSNALTCCGEKMMELVPKTEDAAMEKHVPKVFIDESIVDIKVGEIAHPMEKDHYIDFVAIETNRGIDIHKLSPGKDPETRFVLAEDEDLYTTYAYCNKHGLWSD